MVDVCGSRETAQSTNIGQVLEKHGKKILGSRYQDPISSFAEFQEFSVLNPEVLLILSTLELFIVIVITTSAFSFLLFPLPSVFFYFR